MELDLQQNHYIYLLNLTPLVHLATFFFLLLVDLLTWYRMPAAPFCWPGSVLTAAGKKYLASSASPAAS